MRVLALEPYYGGSHKAFLDGWVHRSRHDWTVFGLPDRNWKKRMLDGADVLLGQVEQSRDRGWDVVFCSDMLNLAGWRIIAPTPIAKLPAVIYFHENQLTYPIPEKAVRDESCCRINLKSAIAADEVWFNSQYHKQTFFDAARRLPSSEEQTLIKALCSAEAKAKVYPQGIHPIEPSSKSRSGPVHILWAARWEHDKNPQQFFEAIGKLVEMGVDFRISVVGGAARGRMKGIFTRARERFNEYIENWGWQESRRKYLQILADADVIVSTAWHEFFGVSVVEAVSARVRPLVPERLAYPEVLDYDRNPGYFYDGSTEDLTAKLAGYGRMKREVGNLEPISDVAGEVARKYGWANIAGQLDRGLERFS